MVKSKIRFLGLCILLSSVILSVSIIYCFGLNTNKQQDRYYLNTNDKGVMNVIDSYTGIVYSQTYEIDFVNDTRKVR